MTRPTLHPLPEGCPNPYADLEGFLTWHRNGPLAGFRMTGPDQPPAPVPTPPAAPAATPPAAPDDRRFGQDDVSRIAAREKEQGERAERRKLAEALGFDPETFDPAAARQLLDAQRAAQAAAETEAQRNAREAAEDRAAAARERAAITAERLELRKTTALANAGLALPDEPLERTAALRQAASLLDIAPDADDAALSTAIDTLRTRFAGLFGTTPPPLPPRAPSGGPTGTPPRTPPASTGDAYERGKARAAKLPGATPVTA